jgi:hypothetical protein
LITFIHSFLLGYCGINLDKLLEEEKRYNNYLIENINRKKDDKIVNNNEDNNNNDNIKNNIANDNIKNNIDHPHSTCYQMTEPFEIFSFDFNSNEQIPLTGIYLIISFTLLRCAKLYFSF